MLRGIRKASSNWLGKAVMTVAMGALIVSFGIWGIADIFRGFGQSVLAKVGHTEISVNEFRQVYTDRLQQIGRQFGRPLTADQARALGFDRQVLQQVLAEAALDGEARQLGLGQSDAETMRTIFTDPNFKGVGGSFDAQRFQAIIRQLGYTEPRYIADQRRVSLRHQLTSTLVAGLEPSKTLLEAISRFQNEERSIEYVRLAAAQAGTIDPPSPETLAGYFDEHKGQFRAPEYRKIAFVVITPEEVGKWSDVSDEDAKKVFEQHKDRFGTPEKRQVSQIVFPTMDDALSARSQIASGTSFEDLAKQHNLSVVDLGLVGKSGVLDTAIADAAFSLPAGEVSQPVQGKFGAALVKIGTIQPAIEPDYASIAIDLKREVAIERGRAQVATLRDKMEDERGGGASVIEAAQKLGLAAVTIEAVDRSGAMPNGQPAPNIPPGLNVVSQAFNSDVGVDNDPIPYKGGYVWYDVLGITPPHDRTLDEVKAQVETRWREDQINDRLRTKATEMVQKLEQGGKLADEAASLGLQVATATGLKRDATSAGVPAGVIKAAFRTASDGVGQTPGPDGSEWFVFRLTGITVPPVDLASDDIKKLKETLKRGLSEEQISQYVTTLEKDIGTSINEDAVAQVTGANNN